MHAALKKALLLTTLLTTLLTVARSAAAVDIQTDSALPPLADAYSMAQENTADAALAASPVPPDSHAISAIPEPPVYMMLLIGVGLLGLVARRQTIPPPFGADQD